MESYAWLFPRGVRAHLSASEKPKRTRSDHRGSPLHFFINKNNGEGSVQVDLGVGHLRGGEHTANEWREVGSAQRETRK